MSLERREQLAEHIMQTQPVVREFVRRQPHDLTAGSWDLVSYSFERGFEVMWDAARLDHSGLLLRPLLMLWRQSVELSIKAALTDIAGEIAGNSGHDLSKLFALLLTARAGLGYSDDDEYAGQIQTMIAHVQAFDPFADRFRYPTSKSGRAFEGVAADFDELFQAHWMITTWCEGAALEVEESRGLG